MVGRASLVCFVSCSCYTVLKRTQQRPPSFILQSPQLLNVPPWLKCRLRAEGGGRPSFVSGIQRLSRGQLPM
jgi:hypothetical protein